MPRSAYERWLPLQAVCTAQISPVPKSKPRVPAMSSSVASAPVRPRRLSRMCAPCVNACRCGCRSPMCRPVMSSNSVASVGTGSASTSPSTVYAAAPVFVSSALARTSPESVSSIASARPSPACGSVAVDLNLVAGLRDLGQLERRGEVLTVAMPAEPRQPEPARGVLRDDRHRQVVIQPITSLHRARPEPESLERGLVQLTQISTPVQHRRKTRTRTIQHKADPRRAELQHLDVRHC